MAALEELCLICAEPLAYVGVLPCGHMDVCGVCCLRMRLVVNDTKCCACQQEASCALITRFQGAFTNRITQTEEVLKRNTSQIKGIKGIYFDDEQYRDEMAQKCALTCVVCDDDGQQAAHAQPQNAKVAKGRASGKGNAAKRGLHAYGNNGFGTLGALKNHLKEKHNLFLCDVCVEGRKIFISVSHLHSMHSNACNVLLGCTLM